MSAVGLENLQSIKFPGDVDAGCLRSSLSSNEEALTAFYLILGFLWIIFQQIA